MKNNKQAPHLYRTIWRWHFYAGLFCIPFILSLSVTGAIYLFKPQIDAWQERSFTNLETDGQRASPEAHIQAAEIAVPRANFASYRLPRAQDEAVVITMKTAENSQLVYVHPYSLAVLNIIDTDERITNVVKSLHGELMSGTPGSVLIELAGCWAIVMILSGLYLWWPRSATGLAGIVFPRVRSGSRQFWRDIHAVTGFWVALFTLFLLISGLPWSLVWGNAFKEVRTLAETPVQQGWTISHHEHHAEADIERGALTSQLVNKAHSLDFAHPVELSLDSNTPHQWKVSSLHQNRMLRADVWLDSGTAEIVNNREFSDKPLVDRIVGIGIAAHEGHLFGWMNQLLGLLVAIGLMIVSLSGFVLWRRRKPQGTLGAPPTPTNSKSGLVVTAITLVLAVLLPLLAASLVLLYILERWVLQRIPPLRDWLGLPQNS